jgi:hypothetical protein
MNRERPPRSPRSGRARRSSSERPRGRSSMRRLRTGSSWFHSRRSSSGRRRSLRPGRPVLDEPPGRRSKRGLMGEVFGMSRGCRPDPGDRKAPPGALGRADTASPPLSQTLWPVHTPRHRIAWVHAQPDCGRDGRDRVPGRSTLDQAAQGPQPEPGHRLWQQRHGAAHLRDRETDRNAVAGATPRQHPPARPAAAGRDQQHHRRRSGPGSTRSSRQVAEGRRQILSQMQKLFQPNQLHRLHDARIPHQGK